MIFILRKEEAIMANWFVCVLGMGTVFCGLICIIVLCYIVSFICKALGLDAKDSVQNSAPAVRENVQNNSANAPIANKQEIVAAACALIAEENGTDVKNIRVVSFKKA